MQFPKWVVQCAVFGFAFTVAACAKVVVNEEQQFNFDPSTEKRSPSVEADNIAVKLSIQPQNMVERAGYSRREGPFEFDVYISANDRDLAWPVAIEAVDGALEVRRRDNKTNLIAFHPTAQDWRRDVQTNFFGREQLSFALYGSKTPYIWDNFAQVREIRLRLKFTGRYPNDEHREYWVEQYYRPHLFKEELNSFELLMRQ